MVRLINSSGSGTSYSLTYRANTQGGNVSFLPDDNTVNDVAGNKSISTPGPIII